MSAFQSPLTFSHIRSNQPLNGLYFMSHNISVYDSQNVFSQYFPDSCEFIPRTNFISTGFLQETRPTSYYSIFLTFSISQPTSNKLEVRVIEDFILCREKPTQTMPSLEVTDSKVNKKCTNIRTFFQKSSKLNNKKYILINLFISIPLSERTFV